MKLSPHYNQEIRVLVTKRLPKRDIVSIIRGFIDQKITFAVSQHNSDYEIWRQILPGDLPRIKNRKEGMTPSGVIENDSKDLEERNFICVWEQGKLVYGDPNII